MKCGWSFRASASSICSRISSTSVALIISVSSARSFSALLQLLADRRVDDLGRACALTSGCSP